MNRSSSKSWLHRSAGALLITTLLVRALVPIGYMPGNLADGKIVELCPVASAATFTLLSLHESHHHHQGSKDDAPYSIGSACPIGTSLFSDALPALEIPVESGQQALVTPLILAARSIPASPPIHYPARAPPLS